MRRGDWAKDSVGIRAAATTGVITARQLMALGVPESTVYRRCRDGGPWRPMLPGIVLLSSGRPTREQTLIAALAHAGPTGMITGLEACRRHGVRLGPGPDENVHLLIEHGRQVGSRGFVVVERTRRLPRPVMIGGLPMAPAARACVDAARRLRTHGDIDELLADAVQRGLCTVEELSGELDSGCRRWTSMPRASLSDVGVGIRSAAESMAKRLWARTGLPTPMWNAELRGEDGGLLGIVDGWVDDVGLAWEIDSNEWHLSPRDHDRTVARAARFAAHGIVHVPTKPSMIRKDPFTVISTLRAAYAHAASRQMPLVRVVRGQARD